VLYDSGFLDEGFGNLGVDPSLWVRRSSPWGQAGIVGLGVVPEAAMRKHTVDMPQAYK